MHPRFVDLTGQRFGRLVAVRPSGSRPRGGTIWRLACDCGNVVDVDGANIRYGRTKSCGCLLVEKRSAGNNMRHGRSNTTLHNIWSGMRQRCENPNSDVFHNYGGRGIKVCERWHVFENFVSDMGERPPGMSIDRIDNDGDYCPENCRWASSVVQVRNRRITLAYEHNGVTLTIKEWGEKIGVPYKVMHHRYSIGKRGDALLAPLRKMAKRKA